MMSWLFLRSIKFSRNILRPNDLAKCERGNFKPNLRYSYADQQGNLLVTSGTSAILAYTRLKVQNPDGENGSSGVEKDSCPVCTASRNQVSK
jgi:hypothetical protein